MLCAGALCRLLRFFLSSPDAELADACSFFDAEDRWVPGFNMKATPRRWRGSAESNLAGRKTIGSWPGLVRWNA